MPCAVDPVEVDERQPALPDDLEVVARDRLAPPGLLDPPAIADLDGLAPAVPADRHERARPRRARPRSAGARAAGGSSAPRSRRPSRPAATPASLGQRRLGVREVDPPDPILPEGQGEPGELPLEPGPAGGLRREQRELLTGRRGRAVAAPGPAGRRRPVAGSVRAGRTAGARSPRRRRSARGSAAPRPARRASRPGRRRGPGRGGAAPARPRDRVPRAARSGPRRVGGGRSGAARGPPRRARSGRASGQPLRGPPRPERLELLAPGPGVDPGTLLAEAGDRAPTGRARRPRRSGAGRSGSAGPGRRGRG